MRKHVKVIASVRDDGDESSRDINFDDAEEAFLEEDVSLRVKKKARSRANSDDEVYLPFNDILLSLLILI